MKVGDPYTYVAETPILHDDGRAVGSDDMISRWFRTNEPGRVFQVKSVNGATYETVFVGFQIIDPISRRITVESTWTPHVADILSLDAHRHVPNPGNGAPERVAHYLANIHPARGHGKTDCGEMLVQVSDGDHFLLWLAAEGFVVVPLEGGK